MISSISSIHNSSLDKKCNNPCFGAEIPNKEKVQKKDKTDEFLKKIENMPPIVTGLSSAAIWFGVGLGIDKLLGKAFKMFKTDTKTSLIMNGIFGLVMGVASYIKAKKEN